MQWAETNIYGPNYIEHDSTVGWTELLSIDRLENCINSQRKGLATRGGVTSVQWNEKWNGMLEAY